MNFLQLLQDSCNFLQEWCIILQETSKDLASFVEQINQGKTACQLVKFSQKEKIDQFFKPFVFQAFFPNTIVGYT